MSAAFPRPPNFPVLLRALAARGMRPSAIARELHVAPSTVGRWLTAEQRPSFQHGVGLIFLATDFAKTQKRGA